MSESKKCERCGVKPKGEFELLDYCAVCSKDLCPDCMALGCCGSAPAKSGTRADFGEDEESTKPTR